MIEKFILFELSQTDIRDHAHMGKLRWVNLFGLLMKKIYVIKLTWSST